MNYPLNVTNLIAQGFAVANSAEEHAALTARGYEPRYVAPTPAPSPAPAAEETVESVRAQLDMLGIKYDSRLGLAKLKELMPA